MTRGSKREPGTLKPLCYLALTPVQTSRCPCLCSPQPSPTSLVLLFYILYPQLHAYPWPILIHLTSLRSLDDEWALHYDFSLSSLHTGARFSRALFVDGWDVVRGRDNGALLFPVGWMSAGLSSVMEKLPHTQAPLSCIWSCQATFPGLS